MCTRFNSASLYICCCVIYLYYQRNHHLLTYCLTFCILIYITAHVCCKFCSVTPKTYEVAFILSSTLLILPQVFNYSCYFFTNICFYASSLTSTSVSLSTVSHCLPSPSVLLLPYLRHPDPVDTSSSSCPVDSVSSFVQSFLCSRASCRSILISCTFSSSVFVLVALYYFFVWLLLYDFFICFLR